MSTAPLSCSVVAIISALTDGLSENGPLLHTHPHMCTHMHTCTYTHIHAHIYIHTYTHIHTCTHTHTHAHTHMHICIFCSPQHIHSMFIHPHANSHTQSPGYYSLMAAGGLGMGYLFVSLSAAELELHPPKYPWSHGGPFSALDHMR